MLSRTAHWVIRALALGLTVLIVWLYHDQPFYEALVPMLFAVEFFAYSVFNASVHDRLMFGEWRGSGEDPEPSDRPEAPEPIGSATRKNVVSLDGYRS